MRTSRWLAAPLVTALLLGGCAGEQDAADPGVARIDVDTPELRQAKAAAGVEECPTPAPAGGPVDGGLPAVTLPCFGGGPEVDLAALRGPLVLNLWASWCGPCREEMPLLQRFHEQHGREVPIIGIDYEDVQVQAAMDLVRETDVTYPLLADPQSQLRGASPFPGRMGLPMFVFVDGSGRAEVVGGSVESLAELVGLVRERLGVRL